MKAPIVVIISGKQGSGKTTLAENLKKVLSPCVHMKFADPLYDMHNFIRDTLTKYDIATEKKDRKLLQWLGTGYVRAIDGDAWCKIARKRANFFLTGGSNVVIDDCRFPNELAYFTDAIKIRLEAPEEARKARAESFGDPEHESETGLDKSLGSFHAVIPTHTKTAEEVLASVLEVLKLRGVL